MEDFCTTPHDTGKPSKEMATWKIPQQSPQKCLSAYNVTDAENCNEARKTLFFRCRSPEALPRRVMQRDGISEVNRLPLVSL